MTWQFPWVISNVDEVPLDVARTLVYVATSGAEGIVGPGDLQVRALATPGDQVRVMPGALVCLNRFSGADQQSYLARNVGEDLVDVNPTGGSIRSDLVYAHITDPGFPGQPTTAVEVETRIIQGVPASTKRLSQVLPNQSGYALARLDIPASTSTIQTAHIVNLREVAIPRRIDLTRIHNQTTAGNALTETSYVTWPLQAQWDIDIPSWAVKAQIVGHLSGFRINENSAAGGNVFGNFRIALGNSFSAAVEYNFSMPNGLGQIDTGSAAVGADMSIPKADRNTTQNLRMQAKRNGGTTGCNLETGGGQITVFTVTFFEDPDDQFWET